MATEEALKQAIVTTELVGTKVSDQQQKIVEKFIKGEINEDDFFERTLNMVKDNE